MNKLAVKEKVDNHHKLVVCANTQHSMPVVKYMALTVEVARLLDDICPDKVEE
jgi:hypothetical protein